MVTADPTEELVIRSLFSCLGIAAYDREKKVGGLLHAMLPSSSMDKNKAALNPSLFVDTGIEYLINALINLGARENSLVFHLAGGADIPLSNTILNIGTRNCEAAEAALLKKGLSVKSKAVGGSVSRSVCIKLGVGVRVDTSEDEIINL